MKRYVYFSALGLALAAMLGAVAKVGLERYRTHRFHQACITGDPEVLQARGYVVLSKGPGAEVDRYVDPRQEGRGARARDRCELKRVGRRLMISFLPGE